MRPQSHLLLDWDAQTVTPLPGDIGHWPEEDCYCRPQKAVIEVSIEHGQPVGTVTHWVHAA